MVLKVRFVNIFKGDVVVHLHIREPEQYVFTFVHCVDVSSRVLGLCNNRVCIDVCGLHVADDVLGFSVLA